MTWIFWAATVCAAPFEPDPATAEEPIPADSSRSYDTVEAVLAAFAAEPTVRQVQRWTLDHAEASPEQMQRWLDQSVSFALLPEVTLDGRLRHDWDEGFEYFDIDGAEPLPGVDLAAVADDADQAETREVKLRLRWELADLVMSSERIRVLGEVQEVVKLRDKLLAEVTRLYFERRRLQVESLLAPKIDLVGRIRDELRLLELTANLDALTGGAFSAAVARGPSPG